MYRGIVYIELSEQVDYLLGNPNLDAYEAAVRIHRGRSRSASYDGVDNKATRENKSEIIKTTVTNFVIDSLKKNKGINVILNEQVDELEFPSSFELMAGARVDTANGIRLNKEEYGGISSSLMTQANTYFHLNNAEGNKKGFIIWR